MSMDRCNGCDRLIDTDFDLDCYRMNSDPKRLWGDKGDYGDYPICLCEWCREEQGLDDD